MIQIETTLVCDGCRVTFSPMGPVEIRLQPDDFVQELRAIAYKAGWRQQLRPGSGFAKDFCLECKYED